MANKQYQTIFSFGGKVQPSMLQAFNSAAKRLLGLNTDLSKMKNNADSSAISFGNVAKKIVGMAAGYLSLREAWNFGKSIVDGAIDAENAEKRLNTLMNNVKGTTQEQINSVVKLAEAQQRLGVVEDDVDIAGASQLSTFNLQASSIQKLIPGFNDLLVSIKGTTATQEDAISIANLLGKAMTGNSGALTRYGVTLTKSQQNAIKYGNESQRVAAITAALQQNFGGLNQAMTQTADGALVQLKNNFNAMKDDLGRKVLPIIVKLAGPIMDGASKAFTWFSDVIEKKVIPFAKEAYKWFNNNLAPIFSEIGDSISKIASNILPTLKGAWDDLSPTLGTILKDGLSLINEALKWIADHPEDVKKALEIIGGAWAAYNITVGLVRDAQLLLNGAMSACPIFALVAAITYLIQNWDKVQQLLTSGDYQETKTDLATRSTKSTGQNIQESGDLMRRMRGEVDTQFIEAWNASADKMHSMRGSAYASGTQFHSGGRALVGENGAEIIDLPRGSKVTPHNKTMEFLRGLKGNKVINALSKFTYSPQVIIQGNASKEDVVEALSISRSQFKKMMDEYNSGKQRLAFSEG